jgi:hypothetical protein
MRPMAQNKDTQNRWEGKYLVLQGYSGSVYIILFRTITVHHNYFGMLSTHFTPLNPPYNDFGIL